MNTTSIHTGDILRVEIRGTTFYATAVSEVEDDAKRAKRGVNLAPLPGQRNNLPSYFATARQIVGHYSKRKGSR